jgi:integrase
MTVNDLLDEFELQHAQYVEPETMRRLRQQLKHARSGFGTLRLDRVTPRAIMLWRGKLPAGSAHMILHTFKQALAYAVRTRLVEENPAVSVPNPEPRRPTVTPFADPAEVDSFADELGDWRPIPIFAAATGLRPQEWMALERGDIDRAAGVVHVRRVLTRLQRVKPYGKTAGSVRRVPLTDRALEALDSLPSGLHTRLVFPAIGGQHLHHSWFHREIWLPGMRAWVAGDENRQRRRPYDLRHTYASFAIAAGMHPFQLARYMGTSMEQIDKTYGHLLPDSDARARELLNRWERAQSERLKRAAL